MMLRSSVPGKPEEWLRSIRTVIFSYPAAAIWKPGR